MPINDNRFLTDNTPECVNVILMDDDVQEPTESFFIDLSTDFPLVDLLDTSATITILDDDGDGKMAIGNL